MIVVTVEEPALLMAVDRIGGGVEIEDTLPGRLAVALQEQVHEKTVQCLVVGHHLPVAIRARLIRRAEFQGFSVLDAAST